MKDDTGMKKDKKCAQYVRFSYTGMANTAHAATTHYEQNQRELIQDRN